LIKNIEMAGIQNAMVTNTEARAFAAQFTERFDRVLVDAPCSGEGMFRKEPSSMTAYASYKIERCVAMQRSILKDVSDLVKPGGRLVYSTCTFNTIENEENICWFLEEHPEFEVEITEMPSGISSRGIGRYANRDANRDDDRDDDRDETSVAMRAQVNRAALRIFTGLSGEGHFVIALKKRLDAPSKNPEVVPHPSRFSAKVMHGKAPWCLELSSTEYTCVDHFLHGFFNASEHYTHWMQGLYKVQAISQKTDKKLERGSKRILTGKPATDVLEAITHIYYLPVTPPDMHGVIVKKVGFFLGSITRGKFMPSHAFLIGCKAHTLKHVLAFTSEGTMILRYLKGETLMLSRELIKGQDSSESCYSLNPVYGKSQIEWQNYVETFKGRIAVAVDTYLVGFARLQDGILKNDYPSGWVM
jgi:NOL1/NOP2/fmu family ribosome biogenesis protein